MNVFILHMFNIHQIQIGEICQQCICWRL